MVTLVDSRSRQLSQDWWDAASVQVHDASGSEVAGVLEVQDGLTPAIWAPTEPWVAGAYEITVLVDLGDECGLQEHTSQVTVDADAATPAFPDVVVEEMYVVDVSDDLANLVCCDGAAPYETDVAGVLCPGYPSSRVEHGGFCTHLRAHGRKVVSARLDEEEPSRFTIHERTQDLRPATQAGRMGVSVESASCLEFEVVDLVTGDRSASMAHSVRPRSPVAACFPSNASGLPGSAWLDTRLQLRCASAALSCCPS